MYKIHSRIQVVQLRQASQEARQESQELRGRLGRKEQELAKKGQELANKGQELAKKEEQLGRREELLARVTQDRDQLRAELEVKYTVTVQKGVLCENDVGSIAFNDHMNIRNNFYKV